MNISGQMDDSVRAVENQTSAEELKSFKRGAGHVMYEVFKRFKGAKKDEESASGSARFMLALQK